MNLYMLRIQREAVSNEIIQRVMKGKPVKRKYARLRMINRLIEAKMRRIK